MSDSQYGDNSPSEVQTWFVTDEVCPDCPDPEVVIPTPPPYEEVSRLSCLTVPSLHCVNLLSPS